MTNGAEVSCEITCHPPVVCRLDAVITIDERGQLVLPKDVREKANIKAGDKLAVCLCERGGEARCICLIRAEELKEAVKRFLGPLMEELFR